MRNAKRFTFNAVVVVRSALTECFFLICPKITLANNFKIYHDAAKDSLYVLTGNDVTISFSVCQPLVIFGPRFFDDGSTGFEKVLFKMPV